MSEEELPAGEPVKADPEIVAADWEALGLRVPSDLADVLRVTYGMLYAGDTPAPASE